MTRDEDYYKVLGVEREATQVRIRKAYRKLAMEFHSDKLGAIPGIPDSVVQLAEERLKEVTEAYGVLSDSIKRRAYDEEWRRTLTPPIPQIEPPSISFDDVEPDKIQTASFVITNKGGSYNKIWVGNPDSWLRVTGYASLSEEDELPMQIEIEAEGRDWNSNYSETIKVRLDAAETVVRVGLSTKTMLSGRTTQSGRSYSSRPRPPVYTRPQRAYTSSSSPPAVSSPGAVTLVFVSIISSIIVAMSLSPLVFVSEIGILTWVIRWAIASLIIGLFTGSGSAIDRSISADEKILTACAMSGILPGAAGLAIQLGVIAHNGEILNIFVFGIIMLGLMFGLFWGVVVGAIIGIAANCVFR